MKTAFIDRDGTIIRDYPDELWRNRTVPELLPNASAGLLALNRLEFALIIVTNQYLIGEEFITLSEYETLTRVLLARLQHDGVAVLDIFYCPHRRDAGCLCMKPRPGLIQQACAQYPDIDLRHSIVVGDMSTDMELAINFGMRGFTTSKAAVLPHPLIEFVDAIADIPAKLR